MVVAEPIQSPPRVLLLEPNHQLRAAILEVLRTERYEVRPCNSLEDVLAANGDLAPTVALVAWQSMQGLLAEEHRQSLSTVTQRLRLVVMVPRRWARLLQTTELNTMVAGLVAKPFEADELLDALSAAFLPGTGNRVTRLTST